MNAVHDITHSMLSCLISSSVCVNYNILLLTFAMGLSPRSLSLSLSAQSPENDRKRKRRRGFFFFFLFFLYFFWLRFHSNCCHCVDPVCSADADDYLFIFLVRDLIYFIEKWVD